MKTYIPRQPKQIRERIEAKLSRNLAQKLDSYCRYLESDRDYVLSQVLEVLFKKDKGFVEWLNAHGQTATVEQPVK
jgi:hypothetical protein